MNLKGCVKCGCVVDLDIMNRINFDEEKSNIEDSLKISEYILIENYCEGVEIAFFCPCCKCGVYII